MPQPQALGIGGAEQSQRKGTLHIRPGTILIHLLEVQNEPMA